MSEGPFFYSDRYGGNYPDVKTMCKGQCEGTGWIPPKRDGPFTKCPACKGTGKNLKLLRFKSRKRVRTA